MKQEQFTLHAQPGTSGIDAVVTGEDGRVIGVISVPATAASEWLPDPKEFAAIKIYAGSNQAAAESLAVKIKGEFSAKATKEIENAIASGAPPKSAAAVDMPDVIAIKP